MDKSKVIRLSEEDLDYIYSCIDMLTSNDKINDRLKVCGFKPDIKFVISAAINKYHSFLCESEYFNGGNT